MNITRDAALCMYFYEEYTNENVKKCKERIEKWGNVEICYNTSPKEPIVVLKQRILGDPFTYRKYRESQQLSLVEEVGKRKRFELKTDAQLKLFLNEAFCYEDPNNSKVYKIKSVATKEIFETIQLYASLFNQRTAQAFAKWCSTHSVSFLKAKPDRNSNSRKRQLYILDDTYYDNLLEEICEYLPRYKASILNLKNMITKSSAMSASPHLTWIQKQG